MKIGIVLIEPSPRWPGMAVAALLPTVRILLASSQSIPVWLSQRLLGNRQLPPANVVLPTRCDPADVASDLRGQGIDAVLCNCPGFLADHFPLDRQIVGIPDMRHESATCRWTQRKIRQRRWHWNRALAEAKAVVVPNEPTRQQVLRHDYKRSALPVVCADDEGGVRDLLDDRPVRPIRVTTPPRVSIVTPSYNQGRFLRRTIDSVLNQGYPHIDYRVCDGGSTDESVAILQSYGDRFPWVSQRDGGQAQAINKGFATATGQIRAYLNSDDVLLPGAVEKAVRWFERHPACDMVYGHGLYIDENDAPAGEYNTLDYSFERMMTYCVVCQPAAFWTTRIAERIGPFDEGLHFALDYDYWLRIDRAGGRIAHLPEALGCTRMYPQTKTASGQARFTREIIAVCLKNAGWVSFPAVQGYWYQRCFASAAGWPTKFAGQGEQLPLLLARLHHVWLNRRTAHLGNALHGLTRHAAIVVRDQVRRMVGKAG